MERTRIAGLAGGPLLGLVVFLAIPAQYAGSGGESVTLFLPLTWLLLTRVLHPVGSEPIPGVAELIEEEHGGSAP